MTTVARRSWRQVFVTPGPAAFAVCYALEACARATLVALAPLQALQLLGSARDVSVLFAVAGCVAVVFGLFMPVLVHRLQAGRVYAFGGALLALAPLAFGTGTTAGIAIAILMVLAAQACLVNAINLLIMANVAKSDLVYADSLKLFGSATPWLFCPALGVYLYNQVAPIWALGLFSVAGAALVAYMAGLGLFRGGGAVGPAPAGALRPCRNFPRFIAQPRLRLSWVLNFVRSSWWSVFFVYTPIYMVTAGSSSGSSALAISIGSGLLYVIPFFAWLAKRHGMRPLVIGGFAMAGVAVACIPLAGGRVEIGVALILIASLAGVALDATTQTTFLRAVRVRERAEMGMVFTYHRDAANLLPHTIFAVLLSFFGLDAVFLASALGLLACAWLGRWVPRAM
ncbi:MAG: MFS transporter [Alphaproteobacteria bacterium]|nr:MFS transporter [Alphaproteobacteria bacterium]